MQLQAIATTRAGNFKFTYTRAGNLHTRVLANAIANLPIHGKSIFPTDVGKVDVVAIGQKLNQNRLKEQ